MIAHAYAYKNLTGNSPVTSSHYRVLEVKPTTRTAFGRFCVWNEFSRCSHSYVFKG